MIAPDPKPLAPFARDNTSDDVLLVAKNDNWPLRICRKILGQKYIKTVLM